MSADTTLMGPFPRTPEEGWKHCLNVSDLPSGVMGWFERGQLWSGIIRERDVMHCRVYVVDILPAVIR
jgi:hypothetical protein